MRGKPTDPSDDPLAPFAQQACFHAPNLSQAFAILELLEQLLDHRSGILELLGLHLDNPRLH